MAGQQFNIEQAQFGIESAQATVTTLGAMKHATTQLQNQMKEMNIYDVDDIQDDMADLLEEMNEVNESLARSYAMPEDIDEADLEAELDLLEDELEIEAAAENQGQVPAYLQPSQELPAQPTTSPASKIPVDEYGLPAVTN